MTASSPSDVLQIFYMIFSVTMVQLLLSRDTLIQTHIQRMLQPIQIGKEKEKHAENRSVEKQMQIFKARAKYIKMHPLQPTSRCCNCWWLAWAFVTIDCFVSAFIWRKKWECAFRIVGSSAISRSVTKCVCSCTLCIAIASHSFHGCRFA